VAEERVMNRENLTAKNAKGAKRKRLKREVIEVKEVIKDKK
jgi:hypothetical protein